MKILSFHPIFTADENRVVAGRDPDGADLAAISSADAVVLPQGCRETLWEMARHRGAPVFPDYTARFFWPGKTGQTRLFRRWGVLFPETALFSCVKDFRARFPGLGPMPGIGFPAVFKPDWGGEGEGIALLNSPKQTAEHLSAFETHSPRAPFLIQKFIPCRSRVLRVVKIGGKTLSYWKKGAEGQNLVISLAGGGEVDKEADPMLQKRGIEAVDRFCEQTKINLAGLDLIFGPDRDDPYFLEINYFFGRKGLGGSDAYYALLIREIRRWIDRLEPGRVP